MRLSTWMRVVAFTGMPGSGKSLAVEVARDRQIPIVRMGDLVRQATEARGLELSDDNVGRVAVEMRDEEGMAVWADRTLDALDDLDVDAAVVDGVRGVAEVERFREALGESFVLVAVHASPGTRFERLRDRDRDDAPDDLDEFEARDRREIEFGIGPAIALADVLVVNEDEPEALRDEVDRVLDRVLG